MTLAGTDVEFAESDLLISTESKEGFVSASENGNTVVLDINLTPELVDEVYVRELVSKIQTMRKEAGFVVTDRITLYYTADKELSRILETYSDRIAKSVLAEKVVAGEAKGYTKDWDLNGLSVTLGVEKQ